MGFDPETYDPFAGYDKHREIRQRVNRVNSEAGLPAVLDWSPEETDAKLLAHGQFAQTRNHDMRRWAAAVVEEHLRWRDPYDVTSAVRGPSALFAFDTRIPFSLAEHKLDDLAAAYLSEIYTTCDVQAHTLCEKNNATEILTVKYGEWVCLGKCCDTCRSWFDDPDERRWENTEFPPNCDPLEDRHNAT